MAGKTFIGTSGYSYSHWRNGVFYPPRLPQRNWLEHYAQSFNTVELNVTFYRLPKKETFEGWYKRTPDNFAFVAKGSRFITHMKRLKSCDEPLKLYFENASGLKRKLEMILWQLPPGLRFDEQRLNEFCKLLTTTDIARNIRHTFEFRHKSWFCNETYDLLKKYNFALCFAHSPNWPWVETSTANFIYLRFHGGQDLYGSNYSDTELYNWATKAKIWLDEGKDVYAYFNNDAHGFAVKNALKFKEYIEGS